MECCCSFIFSFHFDSFFSSTLWLRSKFHFFFSHFPGICSKRTGRGRDGEKGEQLLALIIIEIILAATRKRRSSAFISHFILLHWLNSIAIFRYYKTVSDVGERLEKWNVYHFSVLISLGMHLFREANRRILLKKNLYLIRSSYFPFHRFLFHFLALMSRSLSLSPLYRKML